LLFVGSPYYKLTKLSVSGCAFVAGIKITEFPFK
jgi:hypothetical protein